MSFALMALGWLRKVPREVWIALAVALAFLWLRSHWIGVGEDRCRAAQEAAERKADAKATAVAKEATQRAGKATAKVRERTEEVADEVEREMDAARVCPEPVQPAGVRDAGREAVERARRALSTD